MACYIVRVGQFLQRIHRNASVPISCFSRGGRPRRSSSRQNANPLMGLEFRAAVGAEKAALKFRSPDDQC